MSRTDPPADKDLQPGTAIPDPADPYPYDETYDPGWIRSVGTTFGYRASLGAWEFGGTCPRCRHPTSESIFNAQEIGLIVPGARPRPLTVPELVVRCRCSTQHGKDKVGCGRSGVLKNVVFK